MIIVLDIGKTTVKLACVDAAGKTVAVERTPNRPLPGPPYSHHNVDGIWHWLLDRLADLAGRYVVEAISITTHGATACVMAGAELAMPVMDYEATVLAGADAAYAAARPNFAETLSPELPLGLNLGRQLWWQWRALPQAAAQATAILMYPQYWAFRLTGQMRSEVTSLGCHTDLWAPASGKASSLAIAEGWDQLFPPLAPAWADLGPIRSDIAERTGLPADCRVISGIHDSNASLLRHIAVSDTPVTVVSTGTWVICMDAGGDITALQPHRDMLANIDALGRPVPCMRFMGGREMAVLAENALTAPVAPADVAALIAAGTVALPNFGGEGGPFAGRVGGIDGPPPATDGQRAGLAALYAALMTAFCLNTLGGQGMVIIEGSFARSPAFCGILAALVAPRGVVVSDDDTGTVAGAALLARWRPTTPAEGYRSVVPWALPGLTTYAAQWRATLQAG
jgi:L-fuculokinase